MTFAACLRNSAAWRACGALWRLPARNRHARAPPALRIVIYRRFMMRVAERIARREGAKALVTGESLGQVASQTLDNLPRRAIR